MRDVLLGEVWESFFIEGHKVGFLRRVTAVSQTPNILITTLTIMYGSATFQHQFSFYDEVGYPAHSYLFDTDNGAAVHVRFSGNEMVCQVDEHTFKEAVPADARPSYGIYPLLLTMPFEEGFRLSFTQIEDASRTVQGKIELVSHGWEDVIVDGQQLRLWRIVEYSHGQPRNRYWLDKNRRIRLTHWQGATSCWVASKEEVFSSLPTELVEQARKLIDEEADSDWTVDIEKWLDEK